MLWISGGFTYLGTQTSLLNMRESPMAGIVLRRWPNHQLDFNGKVFTGAYDNLCHFLCLYKVSNWRHHISFKAPLTLLIPVTNNRVTCWCHQTWRNEFRDDFSSELKLHSPTSSNNTFFCQVSILAMIVYIGNMLRMVPNCQTLYWRWQILQLKSGSACLVDSRMASWWWSYDYTVI